MTRVGIYARVSTSEQSTDVQIDTLTKHVHDRGFEVAGVYNDVGVSGTVGSRRELDRLMADARRRKFDAVIVLRFDRFARSTQHLLRALEELGSLGVDFISYSEAFDTTIPAWKMVFPFLAALAAFERELIRERVLAGVRRAQAEGKRPGRPRLKVTPEVVVKLRNEGKSLAEIAALLGCSKTSVHDLLERAGDAARKSFENGEGVAP